MQLHFPDALRAGDSLGFIDIACDDVVHQIQSDTTSISREVQECSTQTALAFNSRFTSMQNSFHDYVADKMSAHARRELQLHQQLMEHEEVLQIAAGNT